MVTNNLGDLLRDLRDPNLAPFRLEEIVRIFNELCNRESKYKGWLQSQDSNPFFQIVHALQGDFQIAPLDAFIVENSAGQSIADNTITDLHFLPRTLQTPSYQSDPSDDTKIYLLQLRGAVGVFGTVQWENNGTGRRGVHMDIYDQFNVQRSGVTLHSLSPTGIASDTIPFIGYFITADIPSGHYFRFSVVQTSGGALTMEFFRGGVFNLI